MPRRRRVSFAEQSGRRGFLLGVKHFRLGVCLQGAEPAHENARGHCRKIPYLHSMNLHEVGNLTLHLPLRTAIAQRNMLTNW